MNGNGISAIRFKTLNCGGISGTNKKGTLKRKGIFNSIKSNDIIILTETKFKNSEIDTYKQDWSSGMLVSCTSEIRAQAGVAILFRNGLAIDVKLQGKDNSGRVVWALVELYAKKF